MGKALSGGYSNFVYGIPKMNEPLGLVQECKIHIMFSGIVERNMEMNV